MDKAQKKSKTFKLLASNFEKKYQDLLSEFESKHADSLTWIRDKGIDLESVAKQASKSVVAGAAAGVMLLSSGVTPTRELPGIFEQKELPASTIKATVVSGKDKTAELKKELLGKLPHNVGPLSKEEEKQVEDTVSRVLGVNAKVELEGKRLNTNYGYIGTESHLSRYPGDNLSEHFDSQPAEINYGRTGMAGGPGAWGYSVPNKQSLTSEKIEMEKYYLVVQTFASPNWRQPGAYQWFKHRKMLAINPRTGQAVVGVLMDAGPALSTGKQYGGSPEIMDCLGLYPPKAKQGVIFLFLDESSGNIPLGVQT